MEQPELFSKKEVFNGATVETLYRQARVPVDPEEGLDLSKLEGIASTAHGFCAKFNQRTYVNEDGILCEQDVPVVLRDGTTIYTDIYRPIGETNIPCIVSWSYYGKRTGRRYVRMAGNGSSPRNYFHDVQIRISRPRLLVPSRLCDCQCRPKGYRTL